MSIISILELAGVAHLPRSRQLIESLVLVEGYREAQVEFGSVAGEEQAKSSIDQFRDLVNRNQVQGNERNIDFWRKQGWDQFSNFVQEKSREKSKTQVKRAKNEGNSITVSEDSTWLVVIPLDKDASCFHGKNTDWCTTKPFAPFFEDYFYDKDTTLIYFLKKDTSDKWAIAAYANDDKIEMFDRQDNKITSDQFKQQTGLDAHEYRNRVIGSPDITNATVEARRPYKEALARIKAKLPDGEIDTQLERDLMFTKHAELTVYYCEAIKGRWLEAEKWLKQSADDAVNYAYGVIGGRWPEAERTIAKDPTNAVRYATGLIGEEGDPDSFDTIQAEWPEGYQAILSDPHVAYEAVTMIDAPWPDAEPVLMQDPMIAAEYAIFYKRKRWPDAEPIIKQNKEAWAKYVETFKK